MCIRYIYIFTVLCIIDLCMWKLVDSTMFLPEFRYGFFKKNDSLSGLITNDGLLSKMNTSSKRQCGDICLSHSSCVAFFHNIDINSCQIHDVSYRNVTHLSSPGTTLYELVGNRIETKDQPGVSCTAAGFQHVSTYCLKIVETSATGSAAKQGCSNLYPGSSLVKITSTGKQNIIENALASISGYEIVFIQGNRHYEGSTLKWLYDDGTELVYTNWNTGGGQPSNSDSSQIFIGMRQSNGWLWHDFSDSSSHEGAYICEIDLN